MPRQRRIKRTTPGELETQLTEEIVRAFQEAGVPITAENVQRALEARRIGRFTAEVADTLFFRLLEPLGRIEEARVEAGFRGGMVKAGLGYIPPSRFAEIVEREGAQRVRAITEETREALREAIGLGMRRGAHPFEIARELKTMIGLLPQSVRALERRRAELEKAGVPRDRIERMINRQAARLRRKRAEIIARTEIFWAENRGHLEAWKQAAENGLINEKLSKKEWHASPDELTCPVCSRLNGQAVPLTEEFQPGLPSPPAHPQCRCWMTLLPDTTGADPLEVIEPKPIEIPDPPEEPTGSEAEAWALEHFPNLIDVDLSGIPPRGRFWILKGLQLVARNCPAALEGFNRILVKDPNYFPEPWMALFHGGGTIVFNREHYSGRYLEWPDYVRAPEWEGWNPFISTVLHEAGHALSYLMRFFTPYHIKGREDRPFQALLHERTQELLGIEKARKMLIELYSDHILDNADELWAYAFEFTFGHSKGRRWRGAMAILEKHGLISPRLYALTRRIAPPLARERWNRIKDELAREIAR